ncbi:MAG: hypothetical protein ACREOD_05120 [Candidatus Dormibacteria bacterium]
MPYAISHLVNPLFTTHMNYPEGVNLAWDTSSPLLGLLGWPVGAAFGEVIAYNTLLTVGLAGSAWTVYLILARWTRHRGAAIFGGLCFLISPYVSGEALEHVFLVVVPLVPLTVLWFENALVRGQWSSRRCGLLLGGLLSAEFFISEEVAASMALMLLVGAVWVAILNREIVMSRACRVLGMCKWAAIVTLPLIAGPVAWQYLGPGVIHGPVLSPTELSGRLLGYVIPGVMQLVGPVDSYKMIAGPGYNAVDFGTYLGIPLLASVGIGTALCWRVPKIRLLALMLATTAVLVLGPELHVGGGATGLPLPDVVLKLVPGYQDLLPVRLSLYLDLFAVLLIGLVIDRALDTRWRLWGVVVGVLVIGSWLPYAPFPTTRDAVPPYFSGVGRSGEEVLFVVPFATSVNEDAAMEWQAVAGMHFSMVDGYYTRTSESSGQFNHGPPMNVLTWDLWTLEHGGRGPDKAIYQTFGFTPIARIRGGTGDGNVRATPIVDGALRKFVRGYFAAHGVTSVVLGPSSGERSLSKFLTRLFGPPDQRGAGVQVWRRPGGGWL